MGDLSKNFSKSEFACKCCGVLHLDPRLVPALQQLRDLAGSAITVHSGYRCVSHNKKEGGGSKSQHIYGKAADITIEGNNVEEMALLAAKIPAFQHGGIGLYPLKNMIHVDVRGGPARWGFLKNKMITFQEALAYLDKMKKGKKV